MVNKHQKILNKCCVLSVNWNYKNQSKGRVFCLPSDKEEREKQMKIIPRNIIPDTSKTLISGGTFFTRLSDSYFIWYKKS